jgi:hypothetical protein
MTYFLSFRMRNVGGPVVPPRLLEGDGTTNTLTLVPESRIPSIVAGRNLLFAAHGFNVSGSDGACELGWLDRYFSLTTGSLYIGVLWPGDSWIPIVDYPFEGGVAVDCGDRLAAFCNQACVGAQSISFLSHSLGARLVLEAVSRLDRKALSVCLTAAAINRDCLTTQYRDAAENCERVSILASHEDFVLKVAFAAGDPFADLLHDDHTPFQAALGSNGPPTPAGPPILFPWQIPDPSDYGHHDYLPSCQANAVPPPPGAKWRQAADFMKRAFFAQPQTWPPS